MLAINDTKRKENKNLKQRKPKGFNLRPKLNVSI